MEGVSRGLSFYRYSSSAIEDHISVVELEEDGVEAWLKTPAPAKNGKTPSEGYKILQIIGGQVNHVPMKYETFLAVTKAFRLPPVELNGTTHRQGACGVFPQEDGSFGV